MPLLTTYHLVSGTHMTLLLQVNPHRQIMGYIVLRVVCVWVCVHSCDSEVGLKPEKHLKDQKSGQELTEQVNHICLFSPSLIIYCIFSFVSFQTHASRLCLYII